MEGKKKIGTVEKLMKREKRRGADGKGEQKGEK